MALERYINFFTDFGFKRLFGSETNKNLLLDFLNATIGDEVGTITSISYMKNEYVGRSKGNRRAIFDLSCQTNRGESIIVELQKVEQPHFVDRALYYSTFPITDQAPQGDWDFGLQPVYFIGILDFVFKGDGKTKVENQPSLYRRDVVLWDETLHERASKNLHFIFLEMPNFKKKLDELETQFDKWLFAMNNLCLLNERPKELSGKVFKQFFDAAAIAKLSTEEFSGYQSSLKDTRAIKNSMKLSEDRGRAEGLSEGEARGKAEEKDATIRHCKAEGLPLDMIARISGMSIEYIENLPATD